MTMRASVLMWMLALAVMVRAESPSLDATAMQRSADGLLSDLHVRGLFNGAVVIGQDGSIVYEGAWGLANAEEGTLLTIDSTVDGGSLAKTFTAGAVWLLVDEGNLAWQAPVTRYVPEFPHLTTTVQHLIEHSAGLPEWVEFEGLDNLALVERLARQGIAPDFEPGSRYSYCNACYDVAALVIERVTGMKWEAFLRQRMLEPLGMRATFQRPVRLADWQGTRTMSYRRKDGAQVVFDVIDNEALYGSCNLYFSARDLHRWATSFYAAPCSAGLHSHEASKRARSRAENDPHSID